jgi:hypothetical protein
VTSDAPGNPHGDPSPSSAPPLPPLVAWVSRNSGWLILLTILAVALIEGVGLFYIKRRANAADCPPASNASAAAADPRCSGARE